MYAWKYVWEVCGCVVFVTGSGARDGDGESCGFWVWRVVLVFVGFLSLSLYALLGTYNVKYSSFL